MEVDSLPTSTEHSIQKDCQEDNVPHYVNSENEETEADSTIHGFNISNITVIENHSVGSDLVSSINNKATSCEGSDSGVEVAENADVCVLQRTSSTHSANSQEFGTVRSCDSSIISCYSNYEEAYTILARRNSTLLEDIKLRNGDATSEGGSESSSITGSASSRTSKRTNALGAKKRVSVSESKTKNSTPQPHRSRSKPPITPKNGITLRGKSNDRQQSKTPNSKQINAKQTRTKPVPDHLALTTSNNKVDVNGKSVSRASSTSRTPGTTPTDDGRWPSINSKPAPLLARSLRLHSTDTPGKPRPSQIMESKSTALEKYATLPRRRKEKSADDLKSGDNKRSVKESTPNRLFPLKKQISREMPSGKTLPPYPRKKVATKTKIYHEISIQTALTISDIEKVLSGIAVCPSNPNDIEICDKEVQVDLRLKDVEELQKQLKTKNEQYDKLVEDHKELNKQLIDVEQRLKDEQIEKNGLKEELRQNTERVLAILGSDSNVPGDEDVSSNSLLLLETRYQKVGQIVIKQENEISELNAYCRTLQKELDKSSSAQRILLQQQQDLEAETTELQEFMQAEKSTLSDALKEAESEIKKLNLLLGQKDKEVDTKQDECKHLVRMSEQRRQEIMGLKARLCALEARSRELLVHQGSHISGAAVALSSLASRLDGLVEQLATCYNISDEDLDDIIYHNEAYTNSSNSPITTPDKCKKLFKEKSPSPKGDSSFVSVIINAIRNAAAQTPFAGHKDTSRDTICSDNSDSTEMLDSETEPCLMMEPVLEDVVIPDGHSHNMISSGHGMMSSALISHSESLNNLSQAILNRQLSEQASLSMTESLNASYNSDVSSLTDLCPTVSLVDQVIDVDNSITRLLKVLRIIQIENEELMNDLQDEKEGFSEQVGKQKEANKIVVKQLKDWEILGARLKSEVKELMQQLSKKNKEMDDLKSEINHHRKEIERLNEDVCELSTACSKSELELKMRDDEVAQAIKKWEDVDELPSQDILGKVLAAQTELPLLKQKLVEKDKQLNELAEEFTANKQVLSENWKEAVSEAKKQYDAIDNALEVLHNIQPVVQQYPLLAKLQRDLEEISFQTASSMPLGAPSDFNANAAMMKPVVNLEIPSPINSTA